MIIECLVGTEYQTQVEISLPEKPSKIGVMVSGGADSALLLYLLCKENHEVHNNKHQIIPFTVPKSDGAVQYGPRVIKYINDSYGYNLPHTIFVGDGELSHKNQVFSGIIGAVNNPKQIDLLYLGENQNPPPQFKIKGMYPNRIQQIEFDFVKHPFIKLYKNHIMSMYFSLGLQDLLKITHTCTANPRGVCGECFACDERAWGLSMINQVEPI